MIALCHLRRRASHRQRGAHFPRPRGRTPRVDRAGGLGVADPGCRRLALDDAIGDGPRPLARLDHRVARFSAAPPPTPILVADDDADILRFISTALGNSGYEVFRSENGEETLRMVRELHPALVVMDLLMPGIDGAEICKAMRADAELAEIPVIFASALAPEVLHGVADSSGATDYLAKPMRLKELLEMVQHYLGQ